MKIKIKPDKNISTAILIFCINCLLLFILLFFISCKSPAETMESSAVDRYESMRIDMVNNQIISRGIKDEKVINAVLKVPRHLFVSQSQANDAYNDYPLPIGMGQTISQPYIVALMTESLLLTGNEKVLEIGTGSGYQAAILSEIVKEVYTVEIITELYDKAKNSIEGYKNVITSNHDGYYGWEEFAPYDRIIVTAAPDHIPQPLIAQLKDGGIMVIPVGPPGWNQVLWKVTKEDETIKTIKILDVLFVPLTGHHGQE